MKNATYEVDDVNLLLIIQPITPPHELFSLLSAFCDS